MLFRAIPDYQEFPSVAVIITEQKVAHKDKARFLDIVKFTM